jgi:hypothetical protein
MTTPENMEMFDRICTSMFDKLNSGFTVSV